MIGIIRDRMENTDILNGKSKFMEPKGGHANIDVVSPQIAVFAGDLLISEICRFAICVAPIFDKH